MEHCLLGTRVLNFNNPVFAQDPRVCSCLKWFMQRPKNVMTEANNVCLRQRGSVEVQL